MKSKEMPAADSGADFLLGGGEMGDRMRNTDWAQTVFGPAQSWPGSLKTSISIILASRFAMVVAWGPDFRFFYNDRYRPVLGASKHPGALGTSAREIFPEAWPFIGPLFESTRQGESVALDDVLIPLNRYGYLENCYFTLSYSPIRDESGGVGGMLAVVAETTERVEGERRLKSLRELARRAADAHTLEEACANAAATLAENPIDIPFSLFYLLDQDGKRARLVSSTGISSQARAVPSLVDLSERDVRGWPLGEVADGRQVRIVDDLPGRFGGLPGGPYPEPAHSAVVAPLIRPGQPHPDGILIFGVSPRRALDDSYRGFYDLAADHILTAIRNGLAHQEERKKAEALAELDRAKTTFFNNVSHEFRTPLTLMLGPLEDVLGTSPGGITGEARVQIELAHRNSLRLLKLVNTLLDFSRIEAGRIEAVYEPVDLSVYTSELASVFRSTIERAGLEFLIDCPPLNERVYVDRLMWEKIVFNLLSNAFKFTFEGRIEIVLRRTDGEAADLVVRDTGTGIPDEEIPHLFERFHRVKGARGRTYEGTGIGLALTQELVRLHAGKVQVASRMGEGTMFTVTLPLGIAHLPAERIGALRTQISTGLSGNIYIEEALRWLPESPNPDSPDGTGESEVPQFREIPGAENSSGHKPRILVADDNADIRNYIGRLLSPRFHVISASDGQAALEAVQRDKPDLILSDIMMPRLDGVGLLQAIRSDPELCTLPVILLSARAGEEARIEGVSAGADDYLVKPFSARELVARVETHLQMTTVRQRFEEERGRLLVSEHTARIQLEEEREILETVNRSGRLFAAELDLQRLVQSLTDAATEITGAQFGSFFYNVLDEREASYMLYTVSGVQRENFAHFPMLRSADLVGPTFRREGIVRIDDVRQDPRYGKNSPYFGMPEGHLSVTSYLAVPVVSRSGEVVGGLFFGHSRPAVFTERHERIVEGLAGQAATAIDNARLFEAAQKARSEAETANRLKDEFLATVSHELRTPLNAMLGWARLLRVGGLDKSRQAKAVEVVERNALAQQQIIEDILDVSRIITGKLRLEVAPIELAPFVEAAVDSVSPSADAKGLMLQRIIDSGTNFVLGDGNRIQQIVWNLLSNAVKFTPLGGRVQVAVERVHSHVEITVRDTGKGISEQFLPYVFYRFRQADSSTTRQYGGLGLGLAIVRHLTELHGGTVRVSSPGEGQGATFTVSLPLAIIHAQAGSIGHPELRLHHSAQANLFSEDGLSLEGIKVLAVDDEADARELLTVVLSQRKAEIKAVASVREALKLMGEWQPDVLLSDISIPDEDGYVLIRKVRSLPSGRGGNVPAAALTAYARSEDRAKALAAGYQTHVAKPVDPLELVAVVASLAGRAGRA